MAVATQGAPDRQRGKEKKLDVKHAVLQVAMDFLPFFLSIFKHLLLATLVLALAFFLAILRNEESAEVASSTLAGQVGVVGGWHKTDCLCRTDVLITEVMGALLYNVCAEVVLVVDDDVVGWSNVPLKASMGLEIEVEQERRRETSVLNRSGKGVAIICFLFCHRRVEPTVMPLSADDDCDLRLILCAPTDLLERVFHTGELFFEYVIIVLSLWFCLNTVPSLESSKARTSLTPSR